MQIYFVRHSEVVKEYQGCYNGHIDIPLSSKGRVNAKELAKKLSHVKFDKAFCSDLLRARETIEPFELDCEIIYTERLREKSWGRHEGMSFEEITQEGLKYCNFEQWINALDGERFESYVKSVYEYFTNVILKQDAKNILVVTHSGVIKTLIALKKEIDIAKAFGIALPYGDYIRYDSELGFLIE